MNFSQNLLLGSTPSALLTWLKKLLYDRLKNRIISTAMPITSSSRDIYFHAIFKFQNILTSAS